MMEYVQIVVDHVKENFKTFFGYFVAFIAGCLITGLLM